MLRWFGRDDALIVGRRLAQTCRERALVLLVGVDPTLAEALDADGLHLPERELDRAPEIRARHADWLITGATHSVPALQRAAAAGMDAALVSPVFESSSPSAGEPLGTECFKAWVADAGLPVYALGGVTHETAPALAGSGACGLASVGAV